MPLGIFLSTLSLRRATGDFHPTQARRRYFYPRSPCGERLKHLENRAQDLAFLSTLSLRRATTWRRRSAERIAYFYPRSPCGERPTSPTPSTIIPHFYPRSPCGERRHNRRPNIPSACISIHALLAESDSRGQNRRN